MFNLHAYDRNLPHVKLGHQNRIYSNRHERAPRAAAATVETTALENFQLYVGLTVFKTYTPFFTISSNCKSVFLFSDFNAKKNNHVIFIHLEY